MHNTNTSVVSLPATISFHDAELTVINQQGEIWLQSSDIAKALGYADTKAVNRIFSRNVDEFTDDMSKVVNLTPLGNLPQETRIFSLRGTHLIAMFARTKRAKEFRKWVLDVLDSYLKPAAVKQKSIAALVADNWNGPALVEIPSIMNACAQRLSGAMCLPYFQSAPSPQDLSSFIANTRLLTNEQLCAITQAALQRVQQATGSHGIQEVLRKINADYLLVNESDLIYSFYNAKRLSGALHD